MTRAFWIGFLRGLAKLGAVVVLTMTCRWREIRTEWRLIDTWRFGR
jgi:hypothetical protein